MIMGIFSRSTKLNSDEYERLTKKLTELSAELQDLKSRCEAITTNCNSLRGLVNRRLSGSGSDDETQELNNPVILPDHGTPFKHR